ncbi:right-handed parallel beta-helix repeat-containing protein [Dokdonella sp.]|uniref:right-handed parallel beta-helix repeat-containing protein n=1 Tax=Dokdonella sp. TaxID=2291710 RepID=UPI0037850405
MSDCPFPASRVRATTRRAPRTFTRHVAAALLGIGCMSAMADTYVVTNTADSGAGSLRQAILDANAHQVTAGSQCARHTITFNIAGAAPHTIQPLSPLPTIRIPITFDGYSQPGSSENTAFTGSNAVIAIELDGSFAGNTDAFVVGAAIPGSGLCPGNTSRFSGLVINRFAGAAISMGEETCPVGQFCNSGGVLIQGNYIGTDVTGTHARGNGIALARPALVFGTSSVVNVVGDQTLQNGGPSSPRPQSRNVISGNGDDAILMFSISADSGSGLSQSHTIRNNYIGVDATGSAALPNAGRGITMAANSSGAQIQDNLISANLGDGVAVLDSPFPGTAVIGNGIGIGIAGQPLGNGGHGVLVANDATGVTVGGRLLFAPTAAAISNNGGAGLFVDDAAIVDAGNLSSAHNGGLALDLAPVGVNANDAGDADTGPNELLNRPFLTAAVPDAGSQVGHVAGSIDAVPNSTYEIHFYLNDSCDAGGSGGGQTLFPSTFASLTTDATGHAAFNQAAQFLPAGRHLTALARAFSTTAVIPALMTSEFSNCVLIGAGDTIFADGFD